MSQGFSHANGTVAQYLSKTYTVAQLDAMNLWQKMDGKIAVLGGAAVLKAINDEAQLEKRHDGKGPENPEIFISDSDKSNPGLDFTKKIAIHNAAITDTG